MQFSLWLDCINKLILFKGKQMKFKLDYILNTFTSTNDITSYCLHSYNGHFGVMNYDAFRKLNETLKLNKKAVLINNCSRHSQLTVLNIG